MTASMAVCLGQNEQKIAKEKIGCGLLLNMTAGTRTSLDLQLSTILLRSESIEIQQFTRDVGIEGLLAEPGLPRSEGTPQWELRSYFGDVWDPGVAVAH